MSKKPPGYEEQAVLRRLLALMMAIPGDRREQRPARSSMLATAAAAYFLLDLEPEGGVRRFVTKTLERLVQQLSRNTQQRQVEYRGQVRGRIVWPATFKARYAQDYDPTRFVCREVRHQYDTLENQLLRYVVERIQECISLVPRALRGGACYGSSNGVMEPDSTAAELGRMEVVLDRLRRNVRLRQVSLPEQINELHLLRAKTSRVEEYKEVAQVYEFYRARIEALSWEELAGVSKRVLLLPKDAGPDGDPWIRLGAEMLRGQTFAPRDSAALVRRV